MRITLNEVAKFLCERDMFLILTHASPDGDTLGGGFALCRVLQKMGKSAKVVNADPIPDKYLFLTQGIEEQSFTPKVVISVDVATAALLGSYRKTYENSVDICIDHHGSNTLYAKYNYVDDTAAAACESIYELICMLQGTSNIDPITASCIYAGISTDTGCFRYTNTTAKTHEIAAKLMHVGADVGAINRVMFETKSLAFIQTERLALEHMELHYDNRCAIIYITEDMKQQTGVQDDDLEGLAAIPRQIEGVLIGVTMKQNGEESFKCSVRTHAPYDASELCAKMGGGGHARAAGCRIKGTLAEARKIMLDNIAALLLQDVT